GELDLRFVAKGLAAEGGFRVQDPAGAEGDRRRQGQDHRCGEPEGRLHRDERPLQRLPRDVSAEAEVIRLLVARMERSEIRGGCCDGETVPGLRYAPSGLRQDIRKFSSHGLTDRRQNGYLWSRRCAR